MLYRLATRAAAFSDEMFADVQHEALERGYALSGSLLDELVAIDDETERRRWLARAIREKWSVYRTRCELRGNSAPKSTSGKPMGLAKLTARADALLQALADLEDSGDHAAGDRDRALKSLADIEQAVSRAIQRLSAPAERPTTEVTT